MKKKEVIDAFIGMLEERVRKFEQSLADTQRRASEAPGSNVSHSDTTKSQLSDVALGIQDQLIVTREFLEQLRMVSIREYGSVSVGALFSAKDGGNGEVNHFLIVPGGGGDSTEVDGTEITSLGRAAPLAQAFLKHRKGDKVTFRGRTLEIIDVK